ncbi:MAG TPA: cupin domain-containing protein [Solirubrobacterales bacterium]
MSREGRVVWMPGEVRTEVHLTGQESGGTICMLVDQPPAGWSLPPHRHRNESETIHVLEGEFELEVEGRRSRLGPGQTAHIPAGVVHAGANVGPGTGRRIVVFSPAGIEGFFLEVGSVSPGEEAPLAASAAAAARHGWEFMRE